jgi:hypothetical protein
MARKNPVWAMILASMIQSLAGFRLSTAAALVFVGRR